MLGRSRTEDPPAPSRRVDASDAHTILGKESRFNGKLAFEGAVRIDGNFQGEISTDDVLLIGQGAEVRAKLNVGTVIIHGYVEGDIVAKNSVEIKAPGRLRGNIVTPALTIERGVVFDGTSRMSPENGAGKGRAPKPPPPPGDG